MRKVKFIFAWCDLWAGLFWDRQKRRLYIFPIPCVGIVIQFRQPDLIELYRGVTYYPNERTGKGAVCNCRITVTAERPHACYVKKMGFTGSFIAGEEYPRAALQESVAAGQTKEGR